MLTGALGTATGADTAFRLTMYLLLALWPLVVYASARLLRPEPGGVTGGGGVRAAAHERRGCRLRAQGLRLDRVRRMGPAVGVMDPPIGVGVHVACHVRRPAQRAVPAVVFVSLTVALHFETGYLALIPIVLFPLIASGPWRGRLTRAVAVGAGALLATAWITVPVVAQGRWAAIDEVLGGHGARQRLRGPPGDGVDTRRAVPRRPSPPRGDGGSPARASCGRPVALHRRRPGPRRADAARHEPRAVLRPDHLRQPAVNILPGSSDIFMRRFMMGAQLAGLYLAGAGVAAVVSGGRALAARRLPHLVERARASAAPRRGGGGHGGRRLRRPRPGVVPDRLLRLRQRAGGGHQHAADGDEGAQIDRLVAYVHAHGGGRVYAGMPSNWGSAFTVGCRARLQVPGEPGRRRGRLHAAHGVAHDTSPSTTSTSRTPGDYALFGIRYLILPVVPPASGARLTGAPGGPVPACGRCRARATCAWSTPSGCSARPIAATWAS